MPHNKRESEKTQQHQERVVIETVRGPESYVPGGFTTGVDTSAMRVHRRINEAGTLDFINQVSGAMHESGSMTIGSTAQSNITFSQVVSVGVSGNQLGIACYNLSGQNSGPGSRLVELHSGADLSNHVIKVMCQGY